MSRAKTGSATYEQHPLNAILPPFCAEEFAALKLSLQEHGQTKPCYAQDGKILLGWHIYLACTAIGVKPIVEQLSADVDAAARVVADDLVRRHLDKGRQAAIWLMLADQVPALRDWIKEVEAQCKDRKKRKPANGCDPARQGNKHDGETNTVLGQRIGVSRATMEAVRNLKAHHPDDFKQVASGTIGWKQAVRNVHHRKWLARQVEAHPKPDIVPKILLTHRDNRRWKPRHPSVLILTDPMYDGESLRDWEYLAKFSAKNLHPDGFLVAFAGVKYLNSYMRILEDAGLYYYPINVAVYQGVTGDKKCGNISADFRPVLVFTKQPKQKAFTPCRNRLYDNAKLEEALLGEALRLRGGEKDYHWLQQPLYAMLHFVHHYSRPGDWVCDPFMGTGTAGVACNLLGRNFEGCEIDKSMFKMAQERLARETRAYFEGCLAADVWDKTLKRFLPEASPTREYAPTPSDDSKLDTSAGAQPLPYPRIIFHPGDPSRGIPASKVEYVLGDPSKGIPDGWVGTVL